MLRTGEVAWRAEPEGKESAIISGQQEYVSEVYLGCVWIVSRLSLAVLQGYYRCVSWVLQDCYKGV